MPLNTTCHENYINSCDWVWYGTDRGSTDIIDWLQDKPCGGSLADDWILLSDCLDYHKGWVYKPISPAGSHPHPRDFCADLWGNSRGSSLRKIPHDFPAEIQGKWRGFFYVNISASFPCGIPGDVSCGKCPCASLKNFKMQINDIGRTPVMWKYPSDDLMSFFVELKSLQVWEISLWFQSRFKNFPWISMWILVSLTTRISACIPSTSNPIPGDSPQNPRDFACWEHY